MVPTHHMPSPCLHIVQLRRKNCQPSSPSLISSRSQRRYRLRTRSQAAEHWRHSPGLQQFCSLATHTAWLHPHRRGLCCSRGGTSRLLGSQSSSCITGRCGATSQTTPGLGTCHNFLLSFTPKT